MGREGVAVVARWGSGARGRRHWREGCLHSRGEEGGGEKGRKEERLRPSWAWALGLGKQCSVRHVAAAAPQPCGRAVVTKDGGTCERGGRAAPPCLSGA